LIEDGEIGLETGEFCVPAQHARPDRMERAEPLHALDRPADQRADALFHLARGLVGEGHGQDLAWPGAARREDVRQPRRQHARLAGASAGKHQHGPVERQHRLALLGI